MEGQTMVSNSTQCGLFIGEYKKYTLSGVTFSFNCGGKTQDRKADRPTRTDTWPMLGYEGAAEGLKPWPWLGQKMS